MTGAWWISRSASNRVYAAQFGTKSDGIAPTDFSGDGKTDIAVFRESSGQWLVLRSEDSTFYGFPFGASFDTPTPNDYDGAGKKMLQCSEIQMLRGICKDLPPDLSVFNLERQVTAPCLRL